MQQKEIKCPEFPYFGAPYPDATCIDGYLWDLDSYEDGNLTHGGEEPCPFCNKEAFLVYHLDEENRITKETLENNIQRWHNQYS